MIGIITPFSLDDNNTLIVNKDLVMGIEPFRKLYSKVRKTKGDSDGRKKEVNYKELVYITLWCHWDSMHVHSWSQIC